MQSTRRRAGRFRSGPWPAGPRAGFRFGGRRELQYVCRNAARQSQM